MNEISKIKSRIKKMMNDNNENALRGVRACLKLKNGS
jgi:hypothetical protein